MILLRRSRGREARLRSWISCLAGFVCATVAAGPCLAAEPSWPTAPYDYVVVDQDLRTVLTQFGANTGLRIALSEAVQGRVHGRTPAAPARDVLNGLAQSFGLDWYYDGAVIWVSATSEAETHLLPLQGVSFNKLRNGLAAADLLDRRFQLKAGVGPDIAIVSGPPRYAAMIKQAVVALAADKPAAPQPAPGRTLVVFRGSSATSVQFP